MTTPPLFLRTYLDWCAEPEAAFAGWLSAHCFKTSTAEIYLWMWSKFCRWMTEHGLTLDKVTGLDVDRFLKEAESASLHGYHFLRLIERAYLYINGFADAPPNRINPASQAIQSQAARLSNAPTSFLDEHARVKVRQMVETGKSDKPDETEAVGKRGATLHAGDDGKALLSAEGRLGTHGQRNWSSGSATPVRLTGAAGEWKRQRDLALAGVFIGGGLRVQEAVSLTISCISDNGTTLHLLSEHNAHSARSVMLEPFASVALKRWLSLRNQKTYGGNVFAANTKGKAMDPSSMFRRIKILLTELGLDDIEGRSCCQTLRNSYIATLFDRELDPNTIAEMAGMAELATVMRLHREYMAFFNRRASVALEDDSAWLS